MFQLVFHIIKQRKGLHRLAAVFYYGFTYKAKWTECSEQSVSPFESPKTMLLPVSPAPDLCEGNVSCNTKDLLPEVFAFVTHLQRTYLWRQNGCESKILLKAML